MDGLRFTNTWPASSKVSIEVPLLGRRVPVGSAARGLCGGMVFTALDVFTAGGQPLEEGQPEPGSPMFDHIVRRLFDSWDLPGGALRYYQWMLLPDADVLGPTVDEQWPAVRVELDAGRPCPLGLVTVRSANPLRLGLNHQVLAYDYSVAGDRVALRLYDPNTRLEESDDVSLRFGPATVPVEHNVNIGLPIRGFFRVRYTAADPGRLERPR